ncbi:MAG: DUF4198 domain-containing protein [Spirochaetia bacterium]|nr:DUF4198 domain-containing protein [Spirochaetia bacterium]
MKKKQKKRIIAHGYSRGLIIISVIFIAPVFAENREPKSFHFSLTSPAEKKQKHESEHAAKPVRKYWLSTAEKDLNLEGYLLNPLGEEKELKIEKKEEGWLVSFNTPFKDSEDHGANNVYVVDKKVVDKTLYIRTAKWITVNHSCGWGHGHKHDKIRHSALSFEKIPFEIVPQVLWDDKFHIRTKTGDNLKVFVYSYGKPVENAKVTVVSEKDWQKTMITDENGGIEFQMIRDYYERNWERFHTSHRSRMIVEAEYEINESGNYEGELYNKIIMSTSMPWKYSPALEDYASYKSGLTVGGIFFILTLGGVLLYRERRRKPFLELDFEKKPRKNKKNKNE